MSDRTRYRLSWVLCLLALIGALCQVSLGARYSPSGEQISGGLPVSSLILLLCGLPLILLNFRDAERPGISTVHGLLIVALSASLLGLPALSRGLAVRELVQIYEVLGFSYVVFLINRKLLLDVLGKSALPIAIVLLLLHALQLNDRLPLFLSDAKLEAVIVLLTPFVLCNTQDDSSIGKLLARTTLPLLCGVSFVNGGLLLCYLFVFIISGFAFLKARRAVVGGAVLAVVCTFLPFGPGMVWESLNPDYDATYRKRLFIEYEASLKAPVHFPVGIGPGHYKEGINYLKGMQSLTPHPDDLKIPRDSNSQYQIHLVESGPLAPVLLFVFFVYLLRVSWKVEDERDRRLRLLSVLSLGSTALFCVIFSKGIGILVGALFAVASAKRFSENERVLYPVGAVYASLMFLALLLIGGKRYDERHHRSAYNRWIAQDLLKTSAPAANRMLTVMSAGQPDTRPATISVEAETAALLQPNFRIVPANDSSGDLAIESPNDSGKGVGKAEYGVDVPRDGVYRFMARVWWEDGCSNSVAVSIGDRPSVTLTDEVFRKWHDIEAAQPFELHAGKCKVVLLPVEDGIKIDYFGLVPVH